MSAPPNQQTDPEQLRREIEAIRRGARRDRRAALAHKADVKAQVREKADEMKAAAQRRTPDTARGGAQQVATGARRHPAPIAVVGALAVGFLVGRRIGRRAGSQRGQRALEHVAQQLDDLLGLARDGKRRAVASLSAWSCCSGWSVTSGLPSAAA